MERVPVPLRDGWVPVALVLSAWAEVQWSYADHPAGRTGLLSVLLPMALVTAGRRRSPVVVALAAGVLTGVLALGVLSSPAEQPPLTPFLVLLVSLFNLGLHGRGPWFLPGAVAIAACLGGLQVGSLLAGQSADDVIPSVLFLAGAFVVGRVLRVSRDAALLEQSRAADAEQARDEHAAAAVAVERARIARELHDVIAHALTGIVVQAGVEARLQADRSDSSRATLRLIEQRGREAMVELRRLLGLLREEGQGPASAPLPSLSTTDGLVEDLRRAGHQVRFERRGGLETLPPAIDLAGYRVLQEALTNVSRHAPLADVTVVLARQRDGLSLRVENGPPRAAAPALGSGGNGLLGMRERVRVYGGRLVTTARPDGGFVVEAHLPVTAVVRDPV